MSCHSRDPFCKRNAAGTPTGCLREQVEEWHGFIRFARESYESRMPGVILCEFQLCRIIAAWKIIAIRQSNAPTHCLLTGFSNFCSITLRANRRVSACVGFRLGHSSASVSWAQLRDVFREKLMPAVASEALPLRTNRDFFDHLPIIAHFYSQM
jgi:hypothetical protein